MKVENRLIINMTDLDHILDTDLLEENKDVPPSLIFLEGLFNELQLNGIDKDIDVVEIRLE